MTISWFGMGSFKIVGKELTVITDPFGKETGLSPVRGNADVILCSDPKNPWCNNFSSISGTPFLVTGPGEYDIKEVFIMGASSDNKQSGTVYGIELENIRIAFLGPSVKLTQLSDQQKEMLEGSDIVLVPVGGKQVMEAETAAKIATQLEPFYIIPHSYKTPGVTISVEKNDKFLHEMGNKFTELDKLSLKKKDLVGETTSAVVLTPQR
ncbi:MAG: MBL fold metallo-hydrolase [Candidatus Saccharibacteria bacterium]